MSRRRTSRLRRSRSRAPEVLLALLLVSQHEDVAVVRAGVLEVERAMAVEHEHARALGKA